MLVEPSQVHNLNITQKEFEHIGQLKLHLYTLESRGETQIRKKVQAYHNPYQFFRSMNNTIFLKCL